MTVWGRAVTGTPSRGSAERAAAPAIQSFLSVRFRNPGPLTVGGPPMS